MQIIKEVVVKIVRILSFIFLLFAVAHPAHAAWYYDIIMNGDIRNAYFAGWKGSDCTYVHARALKNANVPQEYRTSHAEFIFQTCTKGENDYKEFKNNKEMAEKEISYLEKLFVERIPLLKAK
jgi:hypothetical protein